MKYTLITLTTVFREEEPCQHHRLCVVQGHCKVTGRRNGFPEKIAVIASGGNIGRDVFAAVLNWV